MRKLILSVLFLFAAQADAAVKPHGLFTDGMVLQQGMKCPVWGTAAPGEPVTVKIQGQAASTKAGKDGAWVVFLKDLKPGGPFDLDISGAGYGIRLRNVLVGEVWVCSGQSNMEWSLSGTFKAKEAIAKADYPMIRLFSAPKTPQPKPISDFVAPARWVECSPATVPGFSAVGYYFGRDLQEKLIVPVGLIQSAWGGTPAESWTRTEIFDTTPGLKGLKGSNLYNGMIAPLMPFAIRGVIWYQGESNADRAWQYRTLFPAMIKSWRDDWKQGDFPFLFVQLAPWDIPKTPTWAELREAQLFTAQTVKNTAQAVITDYGDAKDIHPSKKEPVGARLALAARALAYGEKITFSGPEYTGKKVDGNKVILTFKSVDKGLVIGGGDKELKGFTIAGADGVFEPAHAKIEGETVVVWSDKLSSPQEVRFGWANHPIVNLFNAAGLPASPFRTDTFPAITDPASKKAK
ncbi:MAG: sialate O-acetylesterase [Gemmataceae bacterium]